MRRFSSDFIIEKFVKGGGSMDIWHRLGRIFRLSNLGVLIFFLLNIGLILVVFCPEGMTLESATPLATIYIVTVLISLSPLGEWTLAIFADAKEIKRKDIKIRLIPLLEIVYNKAKRKTPSIVSSIRLKIIHDQSPNAYAIGRKTICVTDGLLNLSDEEIMAVFAHELGHLAYGHSAIQLLIGGGNLFISGAFLIIKIMCWVISGLCSVLAGIVTRNFWIGVVSAIVTSISFVTVWLWTKFCSLFLMWSMRQNEFIADQYAYDLGFGNCLARVLDTELSTSPENGLLKVLFASHPHTDDRIARLQELGASYSRY